MSNANGAGIKNIGDCGPEGSTLGKDSSAKVGMHGNASAQETSAGTEITAVLNALLSALTNKGAFNFTGTIGGTMILSANPVFGDGDLLLGVGDDYDGIVRSDGYLNFIIDGEGQGGAEFAWYEGGTTVSGSTRMMILSQAGDLTVESGFIKSASPTSGVGYATFAGGAVAQATDRTTGVTLSKVCGTITTHTDSLAAGAAATFTVTNTAVAITDVVNVSIQSGATTVQTNVRVTTTAAGSFNITVENNHASTAETGAIIINYAILKAVVA